MAIPTPYPNIDDTKISDVTTWSSNKINTVIETIMELLSEQEDEE